MRGTLARGLAMPLKACSNAHHVEVVASDIFATRNSLKSQEGRNLKSPFSNIRAVTSKLCPESSLTGVENRLPFTSDAAVKSP
jgi:hypothetical protein